MKSISHKDCDGWAIYEKEYIAGDQPRNIHVVEAKITEEKGMSYSTPNSDLITQCGNRTLVKSNRKCIIASKSPVDIRNKLAELQNIGLEVCGQCVATFYADAER